MLALARPPEPTVDHVGFAVPLQLRTDDGVLRLVTTLTSIATPLDVAVSELHLEAFLPADEPTGALLQLRHERRHARSRPGPDR